MQQIIIDFGAVRLYGYGLMLVFGFLSGIRLAQWRAGRMGEDPETVTVVGILALVGGIVGARAAYIVQQWKYFASAPTPLLEVLNVTSGGLIYYGGLVLATLMVVTYLMYKRLPIRRYLDIVSVSIMVGLAFGRAGCLLNGCCYGARCGEHWPLGVTFPMYSKPLIKLDGRDNPFSAITQGPSPVYAHQLRDRAVALHRRGTPDGPVMAGRRIDGLLNPDPRLVDPAETVPVSYTVNGKEIRAPMLSLLPPQKFTPEQVRIAEASRSLPVRPAQAIGIVNALLIAWLLLVFFRVRRREGQVFALLAVLYPITRFALEAIRSDTALHMGLTHNQYTSLTTVIAGVIMFVIIERLPASAGATRAQRLAEQKIPRAPRQARKKRKH